MQVSVNFQNVETGTYVVYINGQEHTVDALSSQIKVDMSGDESLKIRIVEQAPKRLSIISWIIWLLTIPLQGLYSMLSFYGEDTWFKQINPYLLDAQFLIPPGKDSEIVIRFCDGKDGLWPKTTAHCASAQTAQMRHTPNPQAIFSAYVRYVKQMLSISFIGVALFAFIIYKTKAAAGAPICAALIIAILLLDVFLIVSQYRKAKKYDHDFRAKYGSCEPD